MSPAGARRSGAHFRTTLPAPDYNSVAVGADKLLEAGDLEGPERLRVLKAFTELLDLELFCDGVAVY